MGPGPHTRSTAGHIIVSHPWSRATVPNEILALPAVPCKTVFARKQDRQEAQTAALRKGLTPAAGGLFASDGRGPRPAKQLDRSLKSGYCRESGRVFGRCSNGRRSACPAASSACCSACWC